MGWINGKIKPEEGKLICALVASWPSSWNVGKIDGDDMVLEDLALHKRNFRFKATLIKCYVYLPEESVIWEKD